MVLAGKRVLVVEAEFLVALDIQRMLERAEAGETVFARGIAEAAALGAHFPQYELAIVEVPPNDGLAAVALLERLRSGGIPVIATTTTGPSLAPVPAAVPILYKPFDEAALLAACRTAFDGQLKG